MTVYAIPEQNPRLYINVASNHPMMMAAQAVALGQSLDLKQKVGVVLARFRGRTNPMDLLGPWQIVSVGANGSRYHEDNGCERLRRGSKSGEDYELCGGCSPENHAEAKAVRHALALRDVGVDIAGLDAYMFGHWWACRPCWEALKSIGVKSIYLLNSAKNYFDPASPYFAYAKEPTK